MRAIDRCVYKELAGAQLISLVVLTFIVFTREMGRFAELLIRKDASAGTILQVCISLLPSILIFTVPMSFLIGTLIAFSRLSYDSEIVALRACGVSTLRLLAPVLKVGLLVFILTCMLTLHLLPLGNLHLLEMRYQIGMRPVLGSIRPRVFNEDIPNVVLYVEQSQRQAGGWEGVFLADNTIPDEQRIILAQQGRVVPQPGEGRFQLHFEKGVVYQTDASDYSRDDLSTFETLEMLVHLPEETPQIRTLRAEEKSTLELLKDPGGTLQERRRGLVELNRRLALPLSAFAFAILGLALGAHTRRGGRAYGFLIGLVITFAYFILSVAGSGLAKDGNVPVWLGVWFSDILLYTTALLALRFADRDSRLIRSLTDNRWLVGALETGRRLLSGPIRRRSQVGTAEGGERTRLRFGFLKVLDSYVIRGFASYFFLILAVCVALFVIFTLFELMDDVVKHHIPLGVVLSYFWYLVPHVLTLVVPMSILIATLANLGLLDRTNQITSLKASGVSIYRLAIPIVLSAVAVSLFLFVMQDYVLPFANQKQDNLRNVIKGRATRTFYHPERQWVFGQRPRLYNYLRYDSARAEFANLSFFELDITSSRYSRRTYASRAQWDPKERGWRLFKGFVRDFEDPEKGFASFDEKVVHLPEDPSYFLKEVKESSKMQYLELRRYIGVLQQSGFDVEELRVELYKKISFPLVSVVMAILGIPFAFTLGKRGALHGLALSILIGMAYWGAFGVFGVLGSNGMMAPVLAAWAPNLVFASGGLYLLFTVRT